MVRRLVSAACVALLGASVAASAPTESAPAVGVAAEINGLAITIDARTGSLVRLSYPAVGVVLEAKPDAASLLDVAYPLSEFVPLRLGSRYSQARIERVDGGITIVWEPLAPSRTNFKMPEGQVRAEVTLRPAPDRRSVILEAKIKNGSKALIPQVLFPDLRGLKAFAGPAGTQLRFGSGHPATPFTEDPIAPLSAQYYVYSGWKDYPPSNGYYGINTIRWLDFGGYGGGLSVHERAWGEKERPTVRTYRSQSDPGSLRLLWDHSVRIEPGQTWQSAEFWLTPHPGGWAKGIEPFRVYARQKIPDRPPLPPRVRDAVGFQTIWMVQTPETDPNSPLRFTDLPRVVADAMAHGIHEINLWGWCHYFETPFRVREECGSADDFVDAVKKCKEMGVNISPFVSCYSDRNELAARYKAQPGPSAWVYHPDMVPMMQPYYMGAGYPVQFWGVFNVDPHNKTFQTDVEAAFKTWIDRGVDSWCWDQVFDDKPGSDGLTDLLNRIRSVARAKDPQSSFSGEALTNIEWDADVLDYTWNWIDYVDCAPMTSVFRTPRFNCNVEDSPRIVKAGFLDDMFLNVMPRKPDQPNGTALIGEKPELSKALKEVAHLRQQFLTYFTEGTFIGDSILAEPCAAFVRAYQLPGRPGMGSQDYAHRSHLLIFVMNDQPQAMPVTLKSQLALWLPAASSYSLQSFDPNGNLIESWTSRDPSLSLTTRTLQPLEIAIYDVQAEEQK